jgi:cytochrome oxidase Cu insertion factor (SCO1/SenC/PrrC family)
MKAWTRRSLHAASACAACAGALLLAGGASTHQEAPKKLAFEAPAPGSYRLERIMPAPDGKVIDAYRKRLNLSAYTRGKVTLLSLMYTACSDGRGCPLAFYSIATIKRDLERQRAAGGRVQMVSLSFDPDHDTPEVMRAYGGKHAKDASRVPWHFLTTESRQDLAPLLDGFGQDVSRAAQGGSGELLHVLKLFLVDRDGWVREIYTTSYLEPRVVINDIKTLLLEDGVRVN